MEAYYKITIGYPERLCGPPVIKHAEYRKLKSIDITKLKEDIPAQFSAISRPA